MLVLLSSCASNLKPETQGKKMETFFQNNNNTSLPKLQHQRGRALLATKQASSADFIRTQATELENNFPRLPNPILNMFIVPHLTQGGNPVPGYTTHFKLYKLDHYALPGESL
jgi:conjugative transfer region lipoprotein (TIGR03751 family)